MKEVEAKKMLGLLISCQHTLDEVLILADKLEIEGEKQAICSVVKDVIGELLTECIMPIVSQHPELNPYKDNQSE